MAFTAATVLALVHALDDAFVHRGEGLGMGQHALAGLIAVATAAAAIIAFPRLRPGLRAALAFSFGVLALVNGTLHVIHAEQHGVAGGDSTGFLAAAAGVGLVALAIEILVRHRGTWRSRALGYPASLLAAVFVLAPIALGIVATHKWREPVGAPPSAAYRDVAFEATDGLDLRGWYRPSRNGAAVLVVHGGSSDRKGSVAHAEMLAGHGYGVLLYDARGRGESDGSENNYGWDWAKDIDGALAFLHRQEGIERIGAVGLSTGADVLLEVAAERDDLAAVVADGAAAGSFQDWQNLRGTELGSVPGFVMFSTIRVLSGDAPGTPLMDAVRRIDEPTLLISAGEADERNANLRYDAVAGGAVEHWNLPEADHTRAIRQEPEVYEQRVVGFLNAALR
jgi:pimeloyl-ACP methyl ester carboxylesterase